MTGHDGTSVAVRVAATIAVAGSLLAACGQKGPLYITGVEHPEGGVVRLPLPAASAPVPASAASAPPLRPASSPASSRAD